MPLTVVWHIETRLGSYYFSEYVVNDEYVLVPQRRRGVPYMSCEQVDRFKAENDFVHWRREETQGPHPDGGCRFVGPLREQKLMRGQLRPFLVSEALNTERKLSTHTAVA